MNDGMRLPEVPIADQIKIQLIAKGLSKFYNMCWLVGCKCIRSITSYTALFSKP